MSNCGVLGCGNSNRNVGINSGHVSYHRCHSVLEPKGVNIIDIITSDDKKMFDNILHSFIGINAIQIGLTDVLRAMDIVPDKIMGHSLGEIACAYADGCFTTEETILCAYSRGLVSLQTPLILGSMAAVGLGYSKMSKMCPPEIEVACHNSLESCTISGPADIVSDFVASLVKKGIFAKEVPCSNIAYHSRYIADAGPALLKYMQDLVKTPRQRSQKWLSTSIPQDRWDEPLAKYSSAEYHTNNLLNPVLFEETSQLIPPDAVLIEVAPHALLQPILKRSLPQSCKLLPLTRRGHPQNSVYLLETVGRLYIEGFNPKVQALYPKIEFPVSASTPMLSHLVDWVYQEKWDLPLPMRANKRNAAISQNIISTYDLEHSYLKGHVIRGKNVYPFAATLVSVWDTLAMCLNKSPKNLSVQFKNVHCFAQPIMHKQRQLHIYVAIQKGTGYFEVLNENSLMMTGHILPELNDDAKKLEKYEKSVNTGIDNEDIYKLLHAKECYYMQDFCSIHSVNESLTEAQIKWQGNWVTFLDGLIQLNILRRKHHTVSKLNFIKNLSINIDEHNNIVSSISKNNEMVLNAKVQSLKDRTLCGGVLIENLKFIDLPLLRNPNIVLNACEFMSPFSTEATYNKLDTQNFMPVECKTNAESGAALKIRLIGDLDSLYWVEAQPNKNSGIDMKIHYVGVNIVYVNKLLGSQFNVTDAKNKCVIDFSGVSERGTRLMGLLQTDEISTRISANAEYLWPVPDYWTLEEAATVPLAYSMAFYYLFVKGQIQSYYTICVEGSAGALGQAIISVALAHGCNVFGTVSTSSKKQLLQKLFPQLKSDHIIESGKGFRFVDIIKSATDGKGCDIIISCAKGHLKNFYLQCLGFNGMLIDTSIIHEHEDYNFGMNYLTKQRSYLPCDFTTLFQPKYTEEVKLIRLLMIDGIRRGYVKPLTRSTFEAQEAAKALRLQAACNNRGRVLINLHKLQLNVEPRIICTSSSWQLIMSDNDILALKFAEKLVKRGASKIMLVLSAPSICAEVQKRLWKSDRIVLNIITASWMATNMSDILKGFKEDGLIESIYIMTSNDKFANAIETENNFAAVVSTTCPSIKYFALITTSICDLKKKAKKALLKTNGHGMMKIINLPEMAEINGAYASDMKNMVSINNAIDALERALCSQKKYILARISEAPRETLLETILKLSDMTMENNLKYTPNFTLKQLDLDNSKLLTIQNYLRDVHDVFLNVKDIQNLSIKLINQLEESFTENVHMPRYGIASYYPKLFTDELQYTSDMILMPTLGSEFMYDTDVDIQKSHLCIIPGVEGYYHRFGRLCERLKLPAFVLQPGVDNFKVSITDRANQYIEILKKKSAIKDNFYFLGYESGVLVALEMAAILEKDGLTGTVFCIGGSPKEIISDFKRKLKCYKSDEDLQMGVIKHAYAIITEENPSKLDTLCRNMEWNEKVLTCIGIMRGKIPHSMQFIQKWIDLMYKTLSSLLKNTPEIRKLQSQVIYLHPKYSTSVDLSLQDYSEKKVVSYQIEAPLSFAHEDLMCATIINKHLDSDTLEKFTNKNICQRYAIITEMLTI